MSAESPRGLTLDNQAPLPGGAGRELPRSPLILLAWVFTSLAAPVTTHFGVPRMEGLAILMVARAAKNIQGR